MATEGGCPALAVLAVKLPGFISRGTVEQPKRMKFTFFNSMHAHRCDKSLNPPHATSTQARPYDGQGLAPVTVTDEAQQHRP